MAIKLFPNKETQIRIAEAIENLNITGGADLTHIEEEISDIKADYVTKIALDLQLLEKQGIRPNGSDLLVIDGKINSVYIDSLYTTDVEVVETVSDMLSLPDVKRGDIVVVTDTETTYILKQDPSNDIDNWAQFLTKPDVVSVNGKTGVVVLGISDIDNLQDSLNSKLDVSVYEDDKLVAGDNITIDPITNVISASGGPVGWEDIENKPELFSKDYNDLINKPIIPTKVSDLSNDSDYTTTTYVDNKDTIKEQNNNTDIKFWKGSQTEYNSLSVKSTNTLYFIEEE